MAGSAIHFVFGDYAKMNLTEALARLGRSDRIYSQQDDLSFGPIDPPHRGKRVKWVATDLGSDEWAEYEAMADGPRIPDLADDSRLIVWTSRRTSRDYCGFLDFAWRLGDRPCDVVDVTELAFIIEHGDGHPPSRRFALSPAILRPEEIIEARLFDRARPLLPNDRETYLEIWRGLRAENSAFRIVMPNLTLKSVPIDHFDSALMAHATNRWRKVARIVGSAMTDCWDDSILQVGDHVLAARVRALVAAGRLESQGNLWKIRYSEVRLPSDSVSEFV